jgi:hypothetical protein
MAFVGGDSVGARAAPLAAPSGTTLAGASDRFTFPATSYPARCGSDGPESAERVGDRGLEMDTVVAEVAFVADRSGRLQPLFSAPPS